VCTRIGEIKTSLNENNWTQIQENQHWKSTGNLKDLNEIWVKTRGCIETLTNFKDVYKQMEVSETIRDKVYNIKSHTTTSKLKQEESEQINNYIPVIVYGSLIFNSDKVPRNTLIMSETTNICGEQTNAIIKDQNGVFEFPNEIRTLKGNKSKSIQIKSTSSKGEKALHNLYVEDEVSANRRKHSKTSTTKKCANSMDRANYSEKQNKDNHKILLIGDSHIKRCAIELRQNLDYRYDVLGFSKPSVK
jgi:hypothetical protein